MFVELPKTRLLVWEELRSRDEPASAPEIHEALVEDGDHELSVSTVNRALNDLQRKGYAIEDAPFVEIGPEPSTWKARNPQRMTMTDTILTNGDDDSDEDA